MRKIQFIINPISGGKNKAFIPKLIEQNVDSNLFDYDLWFWEDVDGLEQQIKAVQAADYDGVIAVGGDGTINQIASQLIGTELFVGFVPMGSGNGLCRQLGVKMVASEAILQLNEASVKTIDTGLINGHSFVNVAGVGFDARVSQSFAKSKKRGLLNYGRYVVSEYRSVDNIDYKLTIDGKERDVQAFMLSVANGAQWGNDFFVAPDASLDDGLLDLVIMSKPAMHKIPKLLTDLNRQRIQDNSLVEIIKARSITIECAPERAHVDGEPCEKATRFEISIQPQSLNVFIP